MFVWPFCALWQSRPGLRGRRFREHFSVLPYVGVDSSGRYTLFETTVQGEVGVVLNELTGRQTTVWLPPGCPAPDPNDQMLRAPPPQR